MEQKEEGSRQRWTKRDKKRVRRREANKKIIEAKNYGTDRKGSLKKKTEIN